MCREIKAFVAILDRFIWNLLALSIHEFGGGEDVTDRTRPPREVQGLGVAGDHLPARPRQETTAATINEDEGGYRSHPELPGESDLSLSLGEGEGQPRHVVEVVVEGGVVPVAADEDDLQLVLRVLLQVLVEGHQLRREAPAGRAPVGGEVESQDLVRSTDIVEVNWSIVAQDFLPDALDQRWVSHTCYTLHVNSNHKSRKSFFNITKLPCLFSNTGLSCGFPLFPEAP